MENERAFQTMINPYFTGPAAGVIGRSATHTRRYEGKWRREKNDVRN